MGDDLFLSRACRIAIAAVTLSFSTIAAAQATNYKPPFECTGYEGDAHLNCLYAYIEAQRDTITALQSQLSEQKVSAQRLEQEVERARTTDERRRREEQPRYADVTPQIRVMPSIGYGLGLGFGLGPRWPYGWYGPYPGVCVGSPIWWGPCW
jgi:FtsZ-binding cell division protein ZapB